MWPEIFFFDGYLHVFIECYVDNLLVYTKALYPGEPIINIFMRHIHHLQLVMERADLWNLTFKSSKCFFCMPRLLTLGWVVDSSGMTANPNAIKALLAREPPSTKTEVRSFMGMAIQFASLIPSFAEITAPLTDLTLKTHPDKWEICPDAAKEAFENIKYALTRDPILSPPTPGIPFRLRTDACNTAIGSILTQFVDGHLKLIACRSRKLSPAERKYATHERETLAIVDAVKTFRPILDNQPLSLGTDHKNLVPMLSFAEKCNASPRMTRWAMELSPWNLRRILHYVPGAKLWF